MFGRYDLLLEPSAVELPVMLARLNATFGLSLIGDPESADCRVRWNSTCRFELVLFSTCPPDAPEHAPYHLQTPFTFKHQERPKGAPNPTAVTPR